jgi:hypothetical protein
MQLNNEARSAEDKNTIGLDDVSELDGKPSVQSSHKTHGIGKDHARSGSMHGFKIIVTDSLICLDTVNTLITCVHRIRT